MNEGAPMTPEQIAAIRTYNEHHQRRDVTALLAHIDTLTAAVLDVETLARAMVEADLDDIAEPDDILDSMPEARQMAERIIAEYRAILIEEPHDA